MIACSRRSDSRAREKSSRRKKTRGGKGGDAFSRSRFRRALISNNCHMYQRENCGSGQKNYREGGRERGKGEGVR